jgi:hypothetical protein
MSAVWTAALMFAIIGCSDTTQPDTTPKTQLLYGNSFTSPADSAGWRYGGNVALYYDSSRAGGNQCLQVWGADVGPHAEKVLDLLGAPADIIFRFDAKCVSQPGGMVQLIALAPVTPYPSAAFSITDTLWHSYVDTVRFPEGYYLRIWVDGNGLLSTPILVDNFEVLKVLQ